MVSPFFFGAEAQPLYGVYHPPAQDRASSKAVVLCGPGPQEYMLTHWALRRLAALLSKVGVHVLRFDYFGMGDSAGQSEDGTLQIWQQDIQTATSALKKLAKVERVSLIGYRLGAVLAWRAAATAEARPSDLVLWDPVLDGGQYLAELVESEAAFCARLLHYPTPTDPPMELGGYVLPTALREETARIRLLDEPLPKATRVHLYVGRETKENMALRTRLDSLRRFSYAHVPEEGVNGSGNLLSTRVLQVISSALAPEDS